MTEIIDIYINDPVYPNTTYISEWLNVSSSQSLTFTVYEDQNCDVVIEWCADNYYNIINTETTTLIGGNSTTIYTPVKNRFVRLSVINIAIQPSILEVQGFHYVNNGLSISHIKNVGGYVELFNQPNELRTIQSSDGTVTITQNADNIDLVANVSDTTTITSAGGVSLLNDGTGPDFALKGLSNGNGISLTDNTTDLQINNTGVLSVGSTGATPPTTSYSLLTDTGDPQTGNVGLRYLSDNNSADGGIIWTSGVSNYISGQANLSGVTLSSVGVTGVSLISDGTGPTLSIKGLAAGTGINVAVSGTDITISAVSTSLTSIYAEFYTASSAYSINYNTAGSFKEMEFPWVGTTSPPNSSDFTASGSGRATYTGTDTRDFVIIFTAVMFETSTSNPKDYEIRVNSTALSTNAGAYLSQASNPNITWQRHVRLSTNDYVSVWYKYPLSNTALDWRFPHLHIRSID